MLYWFLKWTKFNMWSGAWNKESSLQKSPSQQTNKLAVSRALDWWSGARGFNPSRCNFFTLLFSVNTGRILPRFSTNYRKTRLYFLRLSCHSSLSRREFPAGEQWTCKNHEMECSSGSRIWSRGGPKFFPRFCWWSEAESGERSKPILAGVQGPT